MSKEKGLKFLDDNTHTYGSRTPWESFDYIEIENAQKAVEIASEPDWISVTDRMPDIENDAFLVCTEYGVFYANQDSIIDTITHWMPLPETPK